MQLKRTFLGLTICSLLSMPAFGQLGSLALSSGSTTVGGTAVLSLTLTSAPGNQPVSLQWTLGFPASDIVNVSAVAGPAATAAGKSLSCGTASGSFTCVLSGANANFIANGIAAIVSVTVSPAVNGTVIALSNPIGSSPSGNGILMTGANATISVTGMPTVSSLSCNPSTVPSNGTSTCTVTLSQAPSASTSVVLTDNSALLSVPVSILVPAGNPSATFIATAASITSTQTAVVTATLGTSSKTASLTLQLPTTISSLSCNPSTVLSGGSSTCTVTLNQSVVSATAVAITDSNAVLTVPSSVSVPAGSATATFSATAGSVTSSQTAVITATLGASSQTASLTLLPAGSGLISAYGFTEGTGSTTSDASGNANTGQLQGASWSTSGKYGSALSFNGTSSYVDLGSGATLQTTASMTWSAWIKATANPSDDGQIVAKSDNNSGWQLKTTPDTGVRTFGIAISPDGVSHTQRYSKTVLSLNTWYHVAGVYNATAKTLDIYVNGALDNGTLSGTVPATQFIPTLNATIGKRSGGFYFNGLIDELRIYSRVLSQTEIQSDMNAPVSGSGGGSSPLISSLVCNPSSLLPVGVSTCTITLNQAAVAATSVSVISNNAALSVPATVSVAAGATSATFSATAGTVTSSQSVVVTATLGSSSKTASLTVMPAMSITSLACSPSSLLPAGISTCTITLNQAAVAATSVGVTSNNAALTAPATVSVAAGATSATFSATAGTVTSSQSVVITATLGSSSKTSSLTVMPGISITSLACSPSSLLPAGISTCTITLNQAAVAATSVGVSSNNAALTAPATVSVAAGATSATFSATAGTVTSSQSVVVTATLGSGSKTASLTLLPAMSITSLACSPSSLVSAGISTCTITLNQAAVAATSVGVTSNNAALTAPATVSVAVGATSATFSATAGTVTSSQSVVITAALGSSSKTASLTVMPGISITSLACSPSSLVSGGISTCTITLNQAAVAATSVGVTSNNAALTAPATVSVAVGATSATFSATAGTVTTSQSVVITAALGSSSKTASLTVLPAMSISSLVCNPSNLISGGISSCTVTLNQASPAAITVAVSDNSTALTVPTSVTVAASSSSAVFSATAAVVTTTQTVVVTAALGSSSRTASLTLQSAGTGLISSYGFSEGAGSTTSDVSGNGNTGQINKATWTSSGKSGSSLSFNGTSGYVDIGNGPTLQSTGSMTWSAWVKASANPPDDGQIVAKSDNNSGWQFKTTPDTGVRTFGVAVSPDGVSHTQRYSKTVLSLNTWYYVAGVYNAATKTLDIYVNGVLDNGTLRGTVPATQVIPTANATIGRRTGGFYFNGLIDDLRIYGRALSQSEIQADMTTPSLMLSQISDVQPVLPTESLTANRESVSSHQATIGATVLALSCSPKTVNAGASAACEVRLRKTDIPVEVKVESDGSGMKLPSAVIARPGQTRMVFQVAAERTAKYQSATISVRTADSQAQDAVSVVPAAGPIIDAPSILSAKIGTPVSFAVAAVDSEDKPVRRAGMGLPAGAAFDPATGRFAWTPNVSQTGRHEVLFRAENLAGQSSTATTIIEVDSGIPVLTSQPEAPPCSPGAIGTVEGKWLSESESPIFEQTGTALALGGTRVKINGEYAPMLYSSPTQVGFICPTLNRADKFTLSVVAQHGVTAPLTTAMQDVLPKVLSLDEWWGKQGLVTFPGSSDVVIDRDYRMQGHPAAPGDQVIVWATGLGIDDEPAAGSVLIKIGQQDAEVESVLRVSGRPGLYAVQVRMPSSLAGGSEVPVKVQVRGRDGRWVISNTVFVSVEALN